MFKKLGKNKLFLALALVVVVVVAVVVYRMTRKENFFNSGLKCGSGTIEDEDESMCVPDYDKLCRYGTRKSQYFDYCVADYQKVSDCGDGTRKQGKKCVPNYDNIICAEGNRLTINEEGQSMCVPNYDTLCEDKPNWNNSCKWLAEQTKEIKETKCGIRVGPRYRWRQINNNWVTNCKKTCNDVLKNSGKRRFASISLIPELCNKT